MGGGYDVPVVHKELRDRDIREDLIYLASACDFSILNLSMVSRVTIEDKSSNMYWL